MHLYRCIYCRLPLPAQVNSAVHGASALELCTSCIQKPAAFRWRVSVSCYINIKKFVSPSSSFESELGFTVLYLARTKRYNWFRVVTAQCNASESSTIESLLGYSEAHQLHPIPTPQCFLWLHEVPNEYLLKQQFALYFTLLPLLSSLLQCDVPRA